MDALTAFQNLLGKVKYLGYHLVLQISLCQVWFFCLSSWLIYWHLDLKKSSGSKGHHSVVRALASHQFGPGSNPSVDSMWVEFVGGSLRCSERFFSGYSSFPLSSKTNISKFQFKQESGRRRTTLWMCYVKIIIYY